MSPFARLSRLDHSWITRCDPIRVATGQRHVASAGDSLPASHAPFAPSIFMHAKIVLLPGDGIGPEVVSQAERVLAGVAKRGGHAFQFVTCPIGGSAIDQCGAPLPEQTLAECRSAQAILLGAVGGPKWDDPRAKTRPEAGLLRIRKELGLFANLRPITTHRQLVDASPLKRSIVEGVDILFIRELTGGLYFGESGRRPHASGEEAWNTMIYSTGEIERVVRLAGRLARNRRRKVTSVDKANVLEVSRLWRQVAARIMSEEFPDVAYDVVLVDAMAMHLISRPRDFDVVVTENMFGDILTDEGSMLPGSLGLLPSASLGDSGPGTLRAHSRLRPRHCRQRHRQPAGHNPRGRHALAALVEFGKGGRRHRGGRQFRAGRRSSHERHRRRRPEHRHGGHGPARGCSPLLNRPVPHISFSARLIHAAHEMASPRSDCDCRSLSRSLHLSRSPSNPRRCGGNGAWRSIKGLQVQMVDDALALGIKQAALNVSLTSLALGRA